MIEGVCRRTAALRWAAQGRLGQIAPPPHPLRLTPSLPRSETRKNNFTQEKTIETMQAEHQQTVEILQDRVEYLEYRNFEAHKTIRSLEPENSASPEGLLLNCVV